MTQNLATKFTPQLLQTFAKGSFINGRTNNDYDWDGTKSIHVLTAITQPLNDYKRSGENRFGTPTELEDTDQIMVLTKEKSFSITVDKGNNSDQMHAKRTGKVTKAQMDEQVIPFWDKYALKTWAEYSGTTKKVIAAIDKDNVIDAIIEARTIMVNNKCPIDIANSTCYIKTSNYGKLLKCPEFLGTESLAKELLTKGVVGQCMNFLIKEVPDDFLPEKTHMLFTQKQSVISARKMHELFVHNNPQGISGTVIEGLDYGDAFILDALKGGVVAINSAA